MSLTKVNYIDNSTIITAQNLNDIQDNIIELNKLEDKIIYGKGKNLLRNTAKSQTINGVTFKVNADGSVTVNGTATNYVDLYLNNTSEYGGTELFLAPGDYICSKSGPVGEFYCGYGKTVLASANIADKKFTAPNGIAWCFLRISEGEQLTNHTFYPMIRLASETDDTYEPYYEGLMESISKSQVVNNFTTTEEGFVADARSLKALNEKRYFPAKYLSNCDVFAVLSESFQNGQVSFYNCATGLTNAPGNASWFPIILVNGVAVAFVAGKMYTSSYNSGTGVWSSWATA